MQTQHIRRSIARSRRPDDEHSGPDRRRHPGGDQITIRLGHPGVEDGRRTLRVTDQGDGGVGPEDVDRIDVWVGTDAAEDDDSLITGSRTQTVRHRTAQQMDGKGALLRGAGDVSGRTRAVGEHLDEIDSVEIRFDGGDQRASAIQVDSPDRAVIRRVRCRRGALTAHCAPRPVSRSTRGPVAGPSGRV